jgi:predicted metal-binding membrane protein
MTVHRPSVVWPWLLVAFAWGAYVGLTLTNNAYLIEDHTWLSWYHQGRVSWWLVLAIFLATWCLMLAAMMTLPTVPMLSAVTWRRPAGRSRSSAYLAAAACFCGFLLVWMVFGVLALIADAALRWALWQNPWTAERPELITVSLLVIAGVYQLLPPKQQALRACHVVTSSATRTSGVSAWRLGWRYGALCLASEWALMLIMFGVGMTNLVWLIGLTALLLAEHVAPRWREIVGLSGVALWLLAALSALPLVQSDLPPSTSAQGSPVAQTRHVGDLTVTLDSSTVVYGRNTIQVVVRDVTGTPVEGAMVSLRVEMVDMDMGTQVVPLLASDADHPGDYRGQVEMTMPGRWELTVVIHPPRARGDMSATFLMTMVASESG